MKYFKGLFDLLKHKKHYSNKKIYPLLNSGITFCMIYYIIVRNYKVHVAVANHNDKVVRVEW